MSRALYYATLLEHDSINKNALGRTWFCGEINTTPTPAIVLPLGVVLDALSKNICHISSPESCWIQKYHLGYFHEVLSSLKPDEQLRSLQTPDL